MKHIFSSFLLFAIAIIIAKAENNIVIPESYLNTIITYEDGSSQELSNTTLSNGLISNPKMVKSINIGTQVKTINSNFCSSGFTNLEWVKIPKASISIAKTAFALGELSVTCFIDGNIPSYSEQKEVMYDFGGGYTTIYYSLLRYSNFSTIIFGDSPSKVSKSEFTYWSKGGENTPTGIKTLKKVVLGPNMTIIGERSFYACSSLENVVIPKNVSSIGDYAFYNCIGLTNLYIGIESPVSISSNVFKGSNYKNATLHVPSGTKSLYETTDVWKDFGNIVEDVISNNVIYYTSLSNQVVTPNNPDAFGANIVSNVYENGLGVITFDGEVTGIGDWAFDNVAVTLSYIKMPNSVEYIGCRAFTSNGLSKVHISENVKEIGEYAFAGTGLEELTLPNGVESIGDAAFMGCGRLTSITIPASVSNIGNWAFSNCDGLSSMTVDQRNTKYDSRNSCNAIIETSTNKLISGCKESIIPNTVTCIGDYAFEYCSLSSLSIPNSVVRIGDWAFGVCKNLTDLTIPNSVVSIGVCAFAECI